MSKRQKQRAKSASKINKKEKLRGQTPPVTSSNGPATAYRHKGEKRRNIPPAAIAAEGRVPAAPKLQYSYSPRLDPVLRFDSTAASDKLPELLEKAKREPLTDAEVRRLADALRQYDPWLEWAGKRETNGFAVDPVALHIHERVSTQAILKVAARNDVTRDLFADPQLGYHEAVQFYRHEMDWSNRLILGDSLQVMASLAQREDLAGKVQMIYLDPPYGIKFGSNFQPTIGQKTVKDKEQDLTREAEMVKAYRDTWQLGVHSYLTYLRDRVAVARELLSDSGSIFVQIGDENVHRVRELLDEIFGAHNFVTQIAFAKTTGLEAKERVSSAIDYLLWYCKDIEQMKYRPLMGIRSEASSERFNYIQLANGNVLAGSDENIADLDENKEPYIKFTDTDLTKPGPGAKYEFDFNGKKFTSGDRWWGTQKETLERVGKANRLFITGKGKLRFMRREDDASGQSITNVWVDIGGAVQSRSDPKVYVVQTGTAVVQRCILMTTDPGDLVLDPTCGSGTTAYVAEQWGRRWITIDTSRVAIALARQRLLTAKFDYYEIKDEARGIAGGLKYKTVPHISLRTIAQNNNLEPIFAKHEPILEEALKQCNSELASVRPDLKTRLAAKLVARQRSHGKRAVTDADRRRWLFPPDNRANEMTKLTVDARFRGWYHWEVPFDHDPDWPKGLQDAVHRYRAAWRAEMDEVNASIKANAGRKELVDQPDVRRGVVRVSGPFSVEAVQPQELSLDDDPSPIGSEAEPDNATFGIEEPEPGALPLAGKENRETDSKNADSYIENMLRLLRLDGVRFPDNKEMKFSRLDPMGTRSATIHGEGRWVGPGETDNDREGRATVCVAFGPQYGPVTAAQVEVLIRAASRRGFDDLLIAGFAFDGPAQTVIEEADHPRVRIHMAHIRPDVNPAMDGLLKETPGSQLFSVFGRPRTALRGPARDDTYTITMQGVDIYDPVTNTIDANRADKVAAWFLDTDYDGRTFCITQAFFPDKNAWEKLAQALKEAIDETAFAALSGTLSLPFPAGKHKTVAVKVIDPRGNEVMRVHRLG